MRLFPSANLKELSVSSQGGGDQGLSSDRPNKKCDDVGRGR